MLSSPMNKDKHSSVQDLIVPLITECYVTPTDNIFRFAGHPFCTNINISQTPILLANTVHYKAMYNSVLTPGRKPPCYALISNVFLLLF